MKKWICLLIALMLVLPMAVACDNDMPSVDVNTEDSGTEIESDTSVPDTTGTESSRTHGVPVDSLDFENESFHVAAFGKGAYYHYFFYNEEESSDPMNSAIYDRQIAVEEAIGVKLEHTMFENYSPMIKAVDASVGVGDDVYQTVLMHQIDSIASYVASGTLYPLDQLPHVNLEADWWNKEQMDILRLGQSTYYGINDYMIPVPSVIFFNKKIAGDTAGIPDFYQLVTDYKWTLDAMESAARLVSNDVNNDGVWDDGDMYGIGNCPTTCLWTSCGQPIVEKNEEGRLELVINTEKAVGIMDAIARWVNEHVCQRPKGDDVSLSLKSGQILFWSAQLTSAEGMREHDVDYGILPVPMYDETQGEYYSVDCSGPLCVPTTIRNPELVGATLELLAFHSADTVVPAFYDIVMDGQLSQDEETPKMLDIIFDALYYDPAISYFGFSGGIFKLFYAPHFEAYEKGLSNFSSMYAENEASANKVIDDFYKTLAIMESLNEYLS